MIYKFKFSNLIKILLTAIILLTLTSFIATFYVIFSYTELSITNRTFYISLAVICGLFLLFSLLLAFKKRYKITNDKIVLTLGLFKWVFDVNKIVEFSLYQNKLILFNEDAKHIRIIIDEKDYDNFVKKVRELNPKIIYSENK